MYYFRTVMALFLVLAGVCAKNCLVGAEQPSHGDQGPTAAEEFLKRGEARQVRKDHAGAVEDFTKVIGLEPRNARAYLRRGQSWSSLREYEKSIADLDKAIELD